MSHNEAAATVTVTEMATFRLPTNLIDSLDQMKKETDISKTVHVTRALREYAAKHYPHTLH
jgi:predicted transcriptional regulator